MRQAPHVRALRDPALRDRAARFWARRLECAESCFRTPGVHLVPHPVADRVFVVALDGCVVAAAPRWLEDALRAPDPASLVDPATLAPCLPPGSRLVGPAFVGYAPTLPEAPTRVESLPHARVPELAALRASVDAPDWSHANLEAAEAPLWVARIDGQVVAAAGAVHLLDEVAHIGVVTHAAYRGRGLARRVVAAAAVESAAHGLLPQYQTLCANTRALAVAAALGFERFALTLAARWPAGHAEPGSG